MWTYSIVIAALVVWAAVTLWIAAFALPSAIYWISYYAVDYSFGFVRRGLGGTIVELFPQRSYFTVSHLLMWGAVVAFLGSLVMLARRILLSGRRSERRLLVAILLPALPFAVTFSVYGPRPELFGAAALVAFALAQRRLTTARDAAIASTVFGLTIATLALIHEAIPQEFALGAILAIAVLGPAMKSAHRWLCVALAVVPGVLTAAVVMAFGRRDLAEALCAQVPHHLMKNGYKVPADRLADYAFGRYQSLSDYHDWVCTYVIPYFGASFSAAVRSVFSLGVPVLMGGFLHGLLVCLATLWVIQFFTGVPIREFVRSIQMTPLAPALALAAMIPVFVTGQDWIRWWMVILINIATVYLTFAADRAALEKPVASRDVRSFVAVVVVLILLPLSAPAGYSSRWADGYTWSPQTGWTQTRS